MGKDEGKRREIVFSSSRLTSSSCPYSARRTLREMTFGRRKRRRKRGRLPNGRTGGYDDTTTKIYMQPKKSCFQLCCLVGAKKCRLDRKLASVLVKCNNTEYLPSEGFWGLCDWNSNCLLNSNRPLPSKKRLRSYFQIKWFWILLSFVDFVQFWPDASMSEGWGVKQNERNRIAAI